MISAAKDLITGPLPWILLAVWLICMNLADFILMAIDKSRARRQRWRIPEATLMTVCALGGSLGGVLGMRLLHHKTKHAKFYIGMPLLLIVHILLLALLLLRHWGLIG